MKGGIGTASIEVGGITVAALVAVNAIGDVVDPAHGPRSSPARAAADGSGSSARWRALRRGELAGAARRRAARRRQRDDDRASSPPTRS